MTKSVLPRGSSVKFKQGAEKCISFEKRRPGIAFAVFFPANSMSKHSLSVSFVNNGGVKCFYRGMGDIPILVIVSPICLSRKGQYNNISLLAVLTDSLLIFFRLAVYKNYYVQADADTLILISFIQVSYRVQKDDTHGKG